MAGSSEGRSAERPLKERIRVKAFDAAIDVFQGELQWEGKRIDPERMRDVLYAFLERQLATVSMFASEKHGASFLYATVDAATIAKQLYAQYAGALPELRASEPERERSEFIFGSYASPHVPGVLFTFFEQGLQEVLKELPQALADIQNGTEPQRREIYFIGSPARDIGHITPRFADAVKEKGAFASFADVYADFIASVHAGARGDIELRGVSMGASFAVKTAEALFSARQATQSRAEAGAGFPFMEVRLDAPVAQTSFSKTRRWFQMRAGFLTHSLWTLATDPYVRATSSPFSRFMKDVSPILAEKGIRADMSKEQSRLKKDAATALLAEMDEGVPVPNGMRVTEVIGLLDILTLSPTETLGGFVKKLSQKLRREPKNAAPAEHAVLLSQKGNRTRWGISAGHTLPNFPPETIAAVYQTDRALAALQIR